MFRLFATGKAGWGFCFMKSRDSMVLYRSFYDAIKLLPDDTQLEIFRAIFEFGLDGIEPELSINAKPFWLLIKPNLQANRTKWESGSKAKRKQSISKTEARPKQNRSKTEAKHKQKASETEANVDVDVDVDKDVNVNAKGKYDLSGYGQMAYLVQRWLDYKKSIKDSYKSQESLDMFVKKLINYSGGNAKVAEEIIETSMANQWKGIFEPKNKKNEQTQELPAGRAHRLHESFNFTPNQ
jgi:hypothetical protein